MITDYTAGSIAERLEDINSFLDDEEIDIIMTSIGGYNSNQLLEELDYNKIEKANKLFIGYSDATAILNAIYNKTKKKTILGPAFVSFCDPNMFDESIDYFFKIINNETKFEYKSPQNYAYDEWFMKENYGPRDCKKHKGWNFIKNGIGKGILVGGNCETFLALSGTKYMPDLDGKILLLESIENEKLAKFERELTQIEQMGLLNSLKGIIIGQFSDEQGLENTEVLRKMIRRICAKFSFPIVVNTSFSHVSPIYSIPIGGEIELDSKKQTIMLVNQ